jgi:prepilin-type N-terminal cleavage/methylation domain-containing protein
MKSHQTSLRFAGFTLVELLVVISIIAVLAGLLLPALSGTKTKARIAEARLEMRQIVNAISTYKADYQRLPAGDLAAGAGVPDFTYGTANTGFGGYAIANTPLVPGDFETNNSEIVAITGDLPAFADGTPTLNDNHRYNPRRNDLLDYKSSTGTSAAPKPDVGTDGVYRDPWGSPYIITLDVNYDGVCLDSFYRSSGTVVGGATVTGVAGPNNYGMRGEAIVWSFGPDRNADGATNANMGLNRDNILSWFSK